MRQLSVHKALILCSIILLTLFSCKYDTKNEFNIEQTNKIEKEHIKRLLNQTKELISQNKLKQAIDSLDVIINSYGTHEEVETAYDLRDEAEKKYILEKIRTQTSIDSLLTYLDEHKQRDIQKTVEDKIEDVVTNTDDVFSIQEFLDSNRLPEYREAAKKRLNEIKANNKKEAYDDAIAENSPKKWKEFLELYPDHKSREKIKDNIIKLEVDDIFSGKYEEIPKSVRSGDVNKLKSVVKIKNDTPYTLTILYSGIENRRIILSSGEQEAVKMKSGNYRVTASVSSANVTNYAGKELMEGNYESTYYIR